MSFRYVSSNPDVVTVEPINHTLKFVGVGEATIVVAEQETGLYTLIKVQVLPGSYQTKVQNDEAVFPKVTTGD